MTAFDPAAHRRDWLIYQQMNQAANHAYSTEVSDHGPHASPHGCGRNTCRAANSAYRAMRDERKAA